MRWRCPLLVLYLIADVAVSVLVLGFFSPSWTFDANTIYRQLFLVDGWSFVSSSFELVVCTLLRTLGLVIAFACIAFHRESLHAYLQMPMLLFAVSSYSFALVKFLAFSEKYEQLKYPGVWMGIIWAILSSGLYSAIWIFLLKKENSSSYFRLEEEHEEPQEVQQNSGERELFSDLETGTGADDIKRLSTWLHIRRLLLYCKLQWKWFSMGFIFLSIYALARVFIPLMMGQVITDVVKTRGLPALIHSVVIMSGLTFVSSIFGGLRGGCFDYATARVNRQVRKDLFSSLVIQDIAFFDATKSAEMVSRLTSDCQTVSTTISTNVNVFLRNGVMLIGALIYMFIMSWRLAMVTFIAIPVVAFITKWYGSFFDKISEKTQDSITKANHVAEEVLSTMRTVRSFACERREAERFSQHLETTLGIARKRSVAYMGYTWTNELCDNAILVSVLFYGGHLVLTDKMTSEQLITFLLYQMQLGENLYSIGYVFSGLMEAVGASRKVFDYMNRTPEIPNDGTLLPTVNGKIELNNVHFVYPSRPNNPVLQGIDLTINAGETVALVGPSGGGKSSIVSLIQHFYEPNNGVIKLDGVPIKDISHSYYHQKIAMVAQEPVLYDGSIRHNILYGCDWATEEDMLQASKLANVHDFVMKLEKTYDTTCGEKGVQMSGGQKQRIAIARALVRRPAVLILDEATSALDAESEALVQEALNRCAHERTVLIIAHRLSTVEKADRIAVVQHGKIAELGSHTELMSRNGTYAALVARQLLGPMTDSE